MEAQNEMMNDPDTSELTKLIPELPAWNDGAGIEPQTWIECVGNYELALGYSLIFWPRFVQFESYVLREGFSLESLRGFETATKGHSTATQAVMNHVHIANIHCNVQANEGQLRYLGRTLKDIYEAKLARDFPNLNFEVEFNDEPGLDTIDYEITFWKLDSGR